jgi:hypothetical protein
LEKHESESCGTHVQVARDDFITFFNEVFDALCKLSADSDPNVQSAAHLLDGLVKASNIFLSSICVISVLSALNCKPNSSLNLSLPVLFQKQ